MTHDIWLAGNLVTTVEAAKLATDDIGRSFTRRQVALMAGRVCSWWPKTCRKMIVTSRRPTSLSAKQWERVGNAVRRAIDDASSVGSAAQVARMLGGRYPVCVVHEVLKSIGFADAPVREEKPYYALDN